MPDSTFPNDEAPIYDDEPPREWDDEWFEEPPARVSRVIDEREISSLTEVTPEDIQSVLDSALAATHERPSSELVSLLAQIRAATRVLARLPESLMRTYNGVFEALLFEAANLTPTAEIDLSDIAAVDNHAPAVAARLSRIHAIAVSGTAAKHPAAAVAALAERVQALVSKSSFIAVIDAINEARPAEEKMAAFQAIEPPTTQVAVVRESGIKTVADLAIEAADRGSGPSIRFSSGYDSLDRALTGDSDALGFIAPGEQVVFAGPTGTGKSSLQYGLARGVARDQRNWNLPDAPILLAHTEEESLDKAEAMQLMPGQRFHDLAKMVVVENVGSSRKHLVEIIYKMVASAVKRSQDTSRPITDFLPHIGFLDYIQAISEPGENDVVANITTAELILRGFQMFDPEEMAKFSGVDFRAYTGMAWPDGIEHHRMAWVVFAQLKKPADEDAMFYKPGKSVLSDFTLEDATSPTGWAWDVRENDYRLFNINQIMGSAKITQNATTVVSLHRSRPQNNPARPGVGPDGRIHLTDVRARLIPYKTRNGAKAAYVPMAFDIQPTGKKAQYYDLVGEDALTRGKIEVDDTFAMSGDPLVPVRPVASPLAGIRY